MGCDAIPVKLSFDNPTAKVSVFLQVHSPLQQA